MTADSLKAVPLWLLGGSELLHLMLWSGFVLAAGGYEKRDSAEERSDTNNRGQWTGSMLCICCGARFRLCWTSVFVGRHVSGELKKAQDNSKDDQARTIESTELHSRGLKRLDQDGIGKDGTAEIRQRGYAIAGFEP
jgi:hypothetical protein